MAVHTGLLYTVLPLALVFGYLSTVLETLESHNDLDRTVKRPLGCYTDSKHGLADAENHNMVNTTT